MSCRGPANNQGILLLAALASIQLVQGLTCDQIELLSSFFEVLGDNLALLASPACWDPCPQTAKKDVED